MVRYLSKVDLHFEVYGHGEPLIILHGLFGSLENWHSTRDRLAGHFRVFTLDQRNHGRSPHSLEMDYRLMAEDIRDFLDAQPCVDSFVLGHSMGGKTAMQFALLHPERVRKLVVVDMAPRRYPPRHQKVIAGMLSLDLNRFQSRQELEAALAPVVPDLSTRQFLLKNLAREPAGRFRWKIGLEEIQQNYSRLTEPVAGGQPFQKPALFLRGEKSDYLLESDLDPIRSLFPRALLRTIPQAAHLVHVENPGVFAQTVLEFLLDP